MLRGRSTKRLMRIIYALKSRWPVDIGRLAYRSDTGAGTYQSDTASGPTAGAETLVSRKTHGLVAQRYGSHPLTSHLLVSQFGRRSLGDYFALHFGQHP